MKYFIVISAVVCMVAPTLGAPAGEEILIIRSESENNGDGTYRFLWETSEGAQFEESGYLKPGGEEGIQVAQGSYQYYSPEGELIRVEYIADENGFQPTGDHIPKVGGGSGSPAASAPSSPARAPQRGRAPSRG